MEKQPSVFITGGSKGIGLALAQQFAQGGYQVAICGRGVEDLKKAIASLETRNGIEHHYFQADVSRPEEIKKLVGLVRTKIGTPSVLINNAGVFIPGKIQEEEDADFFTQINTNLVSTYLITKGFLTEMIERKKGSIYNVCSTASITPYINGGSYCISKYGQYGLTKVLREELKEHRIRVTAVLPGATLTSSWSGTELPPERFVDPEDLARLVFEVEQKPATMVVEDLVVRPMDGDIV